MESNTPEKKIEKNAEISISAEVDNFGKPVQPVKPLYPNTQIGNSGVRYRCKACQGCQLASEISDGTKKKRGKPVKPLSYYDDITLNDDFELPEGWDQSTPLSRAKSLSLREYNKYINFKSPEKAKIFHNNCIISHLKNLENPKKVEIKSSKYDPVTNSIILSDGYSFDERACTIWRSKKWPIL